MKSKRKTLKKKAFEYSENKDLYKQEISKAKANIILGKLKLKFLNWLETSCAGNTHHEWETEKYSNKDHWDYVAWSNAIQRFIEDLQSDDFYVDIIANSDNYSIKVGLWNKNDPKLKDSKKIVRKIVQETKRIPYEIRKELDTLFRGLFNLHEKDENYDHPKYQEYRDLISKLYKKNMTAEKIKTILLKGNKKTNNRSPLLDLLK